MRVWDSKSKWVCNRCVHARKSTKTTLACHFHNLRVIAIFVGPLIAIAKLQWLSDVVARSEARRRFTAVHAHPIRCSLERGSICTTCVVDDACEVAMPPRRGYFVCEAAASGFQSEGKNGLESSRIFTATNLLSFGLSLPSFFNRVAMMFLWYLRGT
jgi:hypothetical protein